ncbi:cupin domain-containing protein [Vineibacter terrae]|uniref:DUF861 domain-containing protein n=1 Tax=Vineibacter terrae TaxID=2586908 RepID=A0A5C8PLX4_9HYPH|nr:cupin domain-containing protein [Vineibacter terrae]TXL75209.1 DUF861 domain-containing protein [Vineibacter terrae]HEX2888946.1 cupin domain-containing protein [Vineibacter terrae]
MAHPPVVQAVLAAATLKPAPINPAWIIDGDPVARIASLSASADGSAWTDLWECTAGEFHWHYEINETIHVLDGGAIVTDRDGVVWDLKPGDVIRFLVGTKAHWRIPSYVRKVAFCSEPLPSSITTLLRARNRVRNIAGRLMGRAANA